jgi:hypothetical protein
VNDAGLKGAAVLVALGAVVVTVGAGCGSAHSTPYDGSQLKYMRTQVDGLQTELDTIHFEAKMLRSATQAGFDKATYIVVAKGVQTELPDLARTVRDLGLPRARAAFAAAARSLARQAHRAITRVKGMNSVGQMAPSRRRELSRRLDISDSQAVRRLQAALDQFSANGYDLGTLHTG